MSDDCMNRAEIALRDGRSYEIGWELLTERRRQIEVEGYNPKHDERHAPAELARAALAYAMTGTAALGPGASEFLRLAAPTIWPWPDSFKPRDPRRDLVRAGALIIAAIERLDREGILHAEDEAS